MSKRIDWIDLSKGVGILLVVLGHAAVPAFREKFWSAKMIYNMVYIFHMQLFFFASGYLFEMNLARYIANKRRFVVNKLRYLMLPYLMFSVINGTIIAIAAGMPQLSAYVGDGNIKDILISIITFSKPFDMHLWFIYTLFIIFLINIAFPKITKHPIIVVLFLLFICTKPIFRLPGILDYVRNELFSFSLARFLYTNDRLEKTLQKRYSAALPFIFIIANFAISYINILGLPTDNAAKCLYHGVHTLIGMTGVISVFVVMHKISHSSRLGKGLKLLSDYSYGIYLVHTPFIVPVTAAILYKLMPQFLGVIIAITVCVGIIVSIIAVKLIRKISVLNLLFLGESIKK